MGMQTAIEPCQGSNPSLLYATLKCLLNNWGSAVKGTFARVRAGTHYCEEMSPLKSPRE